MFKRIVVPAVLAACLAGGLSVPSSVSGADPLCVLLLAGGGETLVNRCLTCREVTLERVRAGEGIPSIRTLLLPAETTTPLPFRGPGRTRVLGERSCPPPPGRELSAASLHR